MRTGDVAAPAINLIPIAPGTPVDRWPGRPVFAVDHLEAPGQVWDGPNLYYWDDPIVWDTPPTPDTGKMMDLTCDWIAAEIIHGPPDEANLFPPSQLIITVADPDGIYSATTVDGKLAFVAMGRPMIAGWIDAGGVWWWLFAGEIKTWSADIDGTVTIEAFGVTSELAQEKGYPWGAELPAVATRPIPLLRAIAVAAHLRGVNTDAELTAAMVDFGTVDNVPCKPNVDIRADTSPLEAMQVVALTDFGVLYDGADGRLTYRPQTWRRRPAEQVAIPVVSDTLCPPTVDHTLWDLALSADDAGLATRITVNNQQDETITRTAPANVTWWMRQGGFTYTPPADVLFADTTAATAMVDAELAIRSVPAVGIASLEVAAHADPDLFALVTDLRLRDRWRLITERPAHGGVQVLDLQAAIVGIMHTILPDSWTTVVASTPALPPGGP